MSSMTLLPGAIDRALNFMACVPTPLPGSALLAGDAFNAALKVAMRDLRSAGVVAGDLLTAAKRVLADLDNRIRTLSDAGQSIPVVDGIADLWAAVKKAEGGAA